MSTEGNSQGESASKNRPRKRMPWWRAYEGIVTAPRWRVVKRRANRPLTEVLGVVFYLLDAASVAAERGDVSGFDAEVCGAALDIETEDAESIFKALETNGWIVGGRIATWDDRQTAVSDDPTAAERQRRHRAKEKARGEGVAAVTRDIRDVTQCHDRGEVGAEADQELEGEGGKTRFGFAPHDGAPPPDILEQTYLCADIDESDETTLAFASAASRLRSAGWPKMGAIRRAYEEARNRVWKGRWPTGQVTYDPDAYFDVRLEQRAA